MLVKEIDDCSIVVGDFLIEDGIALEILELNIISPHEADVVLTGGHIMDIKDVDPDNLRLESEVFV